MKLSFNRTTAPKTLASITAPLAEMLNELEAYFEEAHTANYEDRIVIADAQSRIEGREEEMNRAITVRDNLSNILGRV